MGLTIKDLVLDCDVYLPGVAAGAPGPLPYPNSASAAGLPGGTKKVQIEPGSFEQGHLLASHLGGRGHGGANLVPQTQGSHRGEGIDIEQMAKRSSGMPLSRDVRMQMESAYGQDFSDVRVHTDQAASSLAESIQAKAFTIGPDIFFDRGQWSPDTATGQHLLAHELAHVVQQRKGKTGVAQPYGMLKLGPPGLEAEADEKARTFIRQRRLIGRRALVIEEVAPTIDAAPDARSVQDEDRVKAIIKGAIAEAERIVTIRHGPEAPQVTIDRLRVAARIQLGARSDGEIAKDLGREIAEQAIRHARGERRTTGYLFGKAIQLLAGAVSLAKLLPEVREALRQRGDKRADLQTAEEALQGTDRDANLNNPRKVEFESELAALILANPGPCLDVVKKVSERMLAYLEAKQQVLGNTFQEDLTRLSTNFGGEDGKPNKVFFGRICDVWGNMNRIEEMKKLLKGGGSIHQHLFVQHQFVDMVWDRGKEGDFKKLTEEQFQKIAHLLAANNDFTLDFKIGPKHYRMDKETGKLRKEFAGRGRFNPNSIRLANGLQIDGSDVVSFKSRTPDGKFVVKDKAGNMHTVEGTLLTTNEQVFGQMDIPTTGAPSGIRGRPQRTGDRTGEGLATQSPSLSPEGFGLQGELAQQHGRGIDRITLEEDNLFIQNARVVLDMPMAGAISGTTTDLLEVAKIFGIEPGSEAMHLYATACLGHLEGCGGHSFHEIATAATSAGIPYTPGSYRSFIPQKYWPTVQPVFEKYKDVSM